MVVVVYDAFLVQDKLSRRMEVASSWRRRSGRRPASPPRVNELE